jgi:hypothetical protein
LINPNDVVNNAMNRGTHVMLKTSRMMLLTIGMLLSVASFADDETLSSSDDESLPAVTLDVEVLLTESRYGTRWQVIHPIDALDYSDDWPRPIADLNFRQDSTLERLSGLRNLSLLTLAKVGRTRLYLGLNEDGLVGIHLNTAPRDD